MSNSWPPQQPRYPQQDGPQSPYGPQNPGYGYPDPGYEYPGAGYGQPAPHSGWQQNQWPPTPGGGAWPQEQGGQGQYPYPQYPQQYPQQPQYPQTPQYPQDQYGSPYGYNQPPAPRHRRNWLLPVVLVVVLLIVAGTGAYALMRNKPGSTSTPPTAQSTAGATGTTGIPQGFRAYSDSVSHIRFAIPDGWTTTGSPSSSDAAAGLTVVNPDQTNELLVKELGFTGNNVGAANGALSGAAGSGSVKNKQGPTNVQVAGETWVQESGDVTSNGVTVHLVVLVTTHGKSTYLIGFIAEASSFSSANTKYFQPILNSFTFTA